MATQAALGFRAHSGWAAAVAVSGSATQPIVIQRRRLMIADPGDANAKQPHHAAEGLALDAAERLVGRCIERSQQLANEEVKRLVADLRASGHGVVGCGLLQGSGRTLPGLPGILASHALIHTAEGQMFRDVLAAAARHHRLLLTDIRERDLMARCAADLRLSSEHATRMLAEMCRRLGPPWRQDEKYATLAALLALAAAR
jgi:hypothetical protein